MGQQQLLLIVLGVIIVGIAVVVGINLFNANAEESMKDTLISEGTNLGAMAQQFYKKPIALGGGGNKYKNTSPAPTWDIPAKLKTSSSATWNITSIAEQQVKLTGIPLDKSYTWTVVVTVDTTDPGIQSVVTVTP